MLKQLAEIWDKLTLPKLLLGIAAGVSAVCIYTLWEQRDAVFITLTGSIFAMASIAAGIGLFFVAAVCWLFVGALDRKTDLTHKALSDRIVDLQKQVDTQQTVMGLMREEFRDAFEREQRECRERLKDMNETFTKLILNRGQP